MTYRAALIGCGRIGSEYADDPRGRGINSHAGAYTACDRTSLAAICDTDRAKLTRCGERWKVTERYDDPACMLDKAQPDVVSVCTPDRTHAAVLRMALATPSVRAIVAEKPLALDLVEAQAIVRIAAERDVTLLVNYSRRYSKHHNWLARFLRANGIGPLQAVSGYYTKGTLHNGTHWFDLLRLLAGEVTTVWGLDTRKEKGDDPSLDAVLQLECGASAHLHACDASAFSVFEMDLMGECGRVRVLESGHTIEIYAVAESPHYTGYRALSRARSIAGGMDDLLLYAVQDVVRCLDGGGSPRCSGADAVEALRIAHAVRHSAWSGQPVELSGKGG